MPATSQERIPNTATRGACTSGRKRVSAPWPRISSRGSMGGRAKRLGG